MRISALRCVEHVKEALAATDVDAVPLRVDKQVVSVTTDVRARDQAAIVHREHAELGRVTESDENMSSGLIKRHRKIALRDAHRPGCGLSPRLVIDHCNGLRF